MVSTVIREFAFDTVQCVDKIMYDTSRLVLPLSLINPLKMNSNYMYHML
jgi:hypothetical protein